MFALGIAAINHEWVERNGGRRDMTKEGEIQLQLVNVLGLRETPKNVFLSPLDIT